MPSALVTGANGFVGSHLVRSLVARGWNVTALVRKPAAAEALRTTGVRVRGGDLEKPETLVGLGEGIDHVFHTAAHINTNMQNATEADFDVNLAITRTLIDALAGAKLRSFVHVSSLAAVGIRPVGMIDESFPEDPDLPYGKSKLKADMLVRERFRTHGFPVVLVRPPTVYGRGERYNFLSLCRAIRSGTFVLIGRGDNRMDFCAVENLLDALVLAAERGRPGETYLIRDERPLPFRETVETLWRELRGRPMPRVHLPTALAYAAAYPLGVLGRITGKPVPLYPTRVRTMSGDMCFDIRKAERELGYAPKGPFSDIVRPTLDWYRSERLIEPPP